VDDVEGSQVFVSVWLSYWPWYYFVSMVTALNESLTTIKSLSPLRAWSSTSIPSPSRSP
jgi:hypothetical protein